MLAVTEGKHLVGSTDPTIASVPFALFNSLQWERLPMRYSTATVAAVVSATMHILDRYEDHWWYDNLSHFCAGYAIGTALSEMEDDKQVVCQRFLVITSLWELFEYSIDERPWDDSVEDFDHAMEDTVLDTYMGLTGAFIASHLS